MNPKPNKWKIILSIGAIIIWYLLFLWLSSSVRCNYYPCPATFKGSDCPKVFVLNILPDISCSGGCFCDKPTLVSSILIQIIILLLPGILTYLIWSFIQKEK
ncbi:hypothetical protein HYW76_02420 [Candidatus Pacearchaeota archaeon]|nr:hypothetical protein [Candidatus Pacearchaeota archaeon]